MQGNTSGTATEHATSGNATEHVIARWQAHVWCNSKDSQHVILSVQKNACAMFAKLQHKIL